MVLGHEFCTGEATLGRRTTWVMIGVLGHEFALVRLSWAVEQPGLIGRVELTAMGFITL